MDRVSEPSAFGKASTLTPEDNIVFLFFLTAYETSPITFNMCTFIFQETYNDNFAKLETPVPARSQKVSNLGQGQHMDHPRVDVDAVATTGPPNTCSRGKIYRYMLEKVIYSAMLFYTSSNQLGRDRVSTYPLSSMQSLLQSTAPITPWKSPTTSQVHTAYGTLSTYPLALCSPCSRARRP